MLLLGVVVDDEDAASAVRFQGRQVRMRVEGSAAEDWRVGIMRLDAKASGTR